MPLISEGGLRLFKQYNEIRENFKENEILLFKIGNFYESFYDDAKNISRAAFLPLGYLIDENGMRINHCRMKIEGSDKVIEELRKAGYKPVIISE